MFVIVSGLARLSYTHCEFGVIGRLRVSSIQIDDVPNGGVGSLKKEDERGSWSPAKVDFGRGNFRGIIAC